MGEEAFRYKQTNKQTNVEINSAQQQMHRGVMIDSESKTNRRIFYG